MKNYMKNYMKEYLKNFYKSLREHAMKIINFTKKIEIINKRAAGMI